MEAVRARFRDRVHHASAVLSILGIEAVRDQPELLDGIEVRNQTGTLISAFANVSVIYQNAFAVSRWPLTETLPADKSPRPACPAESSLT